MRSTSEFFSKVFIHSERWIRTPDIRGWNFNNKMLPLYKKEFKNMPNRVLITDWAGTLSSDGSLWATKAFQNILKEKLKTVVPLKYLRAPMGLKKSEHFNELLFNSPFIKAQFNTIYGRNPTPSDGEEFAHLYNCLKVKPEYGALLPGAASVLNDLKNKYNFKVGITTGFNRHLLNQFIYLADQQSTIWDGPFCFASSVAADEITHSRPEIDGILKNLKIMGHHPDTFTKDSKSLIIKIGDTKHDIEEGRNFDNCWTVAVTGTGSHLNINELSDLPSMTYDEWSNREALAKDELKKSKPNFLVPSFNYLPGVINFIEWGIKMGVTADHDDFKCLDVPAMCRMVDRDDELFI